VVLIKHACHLGRAAADLGMHRNTLTRIIQKLEIDPKLVRGGCVADRMIKPWLLVTHNQFGGILVIA
jgi:DNA-binding PucR family transcriptional regulator